MLINLSAQRLMSNDLMTSYCCHKSIMAWKVLIHLFLLATIVCLCAGKLMLKPRDTDAKINHSAYFNCSTDLLSSDIFWFHGSNYIYAGGMILEPYNERFKTEKYTWNGTFSNNLIIQSVQPGDAGEYICADDEIFGEKYSVQLVVLDSDPICRSNRNLDEVIGQNTCNVEPDEVELSCSGTYHGKIPPQLEWKRIGGEKPISEGLSNVISSNHYNYILKLKGDISLGNSSYVCQATRIVHEPRKCITKVINVLYALSDNSRVNIRLDDEIRCHANTTQSCNYTWRWFQNNDVTTESYSAILIPRKTGLHKCEAECYLINETCNLLVMEAMVYGNTESSQMMNAIISVSVSVVVTLVVVVALIFFLCFRNRNKAKESLVTNEEDRAPLIQPPKNNELQPVMLDIDEEISRYPMNSRPRGMCLIINIANFDSGHRHLPPRRGAEKDAELLAKLFKDLHFEVQVHNDVNAQTLDFLFLTTHITDHTKYDAFVCCIVTRGELGVIYTSDGKPVEILRLVDYLTDKKCPSLKEKPKMFFIQACQNVVTEVWPAIYDEDAIVSMLHETLPTTSKHSAVLVPGSPDFLMSYSTLPGSVSYRDTHTGSLYIQALYDCLRKGMEIDRALKMVSSKVRDNLRQRGEDDEGPERFQLPFHLTSGMDRLIYL